MRHLQNDECGFTSALKAIGGKWKPAILWEVTLAPRRFGELRRRLPGISEKVLTQQLREMEADDLIARTVFPGAVPKVEYSVTAFGRTLNDAVTAMSKWGKAYERHMAARQSGRSAVGELPRLPA
jgi:DNA-binding HxlR family transcriptional regulator